MPKKAKFKFVNYDGSLAAHPHAERKGTLVLPSRTPPKWRLYWGVGRCIQGGLTRYPIEVEATGPSSCRAVIRDVKDTSVAASLDLPRNAASDVQAALKERESSTVAAGRRQLASGPPAPAPTAKPSFDRVRYLGGIPSLGKERYGPLSVGSAGFFIGTVKYIRILMTDIKSVEVTGEAPKTDGTVNSKQRTAVAVHLKSGEVACIEIKKTTVAEVRGKLAAVLRAADVPLHVRGVAAHACGGRARPGTH